MTEPLPPLDHLRAFESAARHLSFKQAAEEMNVTAAAVGQRIRALEALLRCKLFTRQVRRVKLTPEGQLLFDDISAGLMLMKGAISRHWARQDHQTLRVSTTNSFTELILLPCLPEFTEQFPDDNVRIISTDERLDPTQHETDVCIRLGTGKAPGCNSVSLGRQVYVPVCSPDLLKGFPDRAGPQELLSMPLIAEEWTVERAAAPSWEQWMANRAVAFEPKRPMIRVSLEAHAVKAALHGQGVALAGAKSVDTFIKTGALIELSGTSGRDLAAYDYHVIWRKDEASRLVQAFVEWVQDRLG